MTKGASPRGFTLMEVALVMVIVGLLAGAGVSLMGMLTERKARNAARDYLQQCLSSLTGFAQINGRLPWADTDVPPDGQENLNAASGTLPFITLGAEPADAFKRPPKYAVNSGLGINRSTTCSVLQAGLSGAPRIVDGDGPASAFSVAAVVVSAGPSDADDDGDVFDALSGGTHQGDNTDGIPNYLRYPPNDDFDDLAAFLNAYALYADICGKPVLSIQNNGAAAAYVYDQTRGADIGIVDAGQTRSFQVVAGRRFDLRDAAGGSGGILPSTPATPMVAAGAGAAVTIP